MKKTIKLTKKAPDKKGAIRLTRKGVTVPGSEANRAVVTSGSRKRYA